MTATRTGRVDGQDPEAGDGSMRGHEAGTVGGAGSHRARARDWAWRRKIRSNPQSFRIYRTVVGTLGFVIVAAGLVMVPFPGPGWVVVFIGVSIWASEFDWAKRLHGFGIRKLKEWNAWVQRKGIVVQGALFVLTCLFVNAVLWTSLKLSGIPGWVPDGVEALMHTYLAL